MTALEVSTSATSSSSSSESTATKPTLLTAVVAYLTASDHKRIGRLLISFSAIFAVGTAIEGAVLGAERISPSSSLVDAGIIVQLFSALRFDLIFSVAIPLMLGLAVAVVPMQVGARAIAFARSAMLGFYLWLFGVILVGSSYLNNGGPGGGATEMVDLFLAGLGLVIAGLLLISASVATTVLASRRAGMTLIETPIFSWSALVASISLLLTLPVLAGALIYVAVDHTYERATFGATEGVNAWIGWAFTSPQIFIVAIPTLGVLAQIVATMTRGKQPLRAGLFVGVGLMSTAVIGAVTQSSHTVNFSGNISDILKSLIPYLFFNDLSILGVLVVLGLCLLALKKERAKLNAAFVPAFLGVGMVFTGMVGNAGYKIINLELSNTVFEEGVLVYICYGVLLSGIGAVAHFGPRIWGREIPSKPVLGLGLLGFLATVLASLPYFIAGFVDQPASVANGFDYSGPIWLWNSLVAAGHALMALVVTLFFALAAKSFRSGPISTATSADLFESVNG
ncbi:MAG: cbb3-type cytochrome c oxidase subunit I [Actinomycetota bacterium]|nr:cbb3-type cytochrome c oxidase subunit I [Actinomycetota bacterium]